MSWDFDVFFVAKKMPNIAVIPQSLIELCRVWAFLDVFLETSKYHEIRISLLLCGSFIFSSILKHLSSYFQDQKLTKEEVLNKFDVFVGSQATDFGDALTGHEELWFLFPINLKTRLLKLGCQIMLVMYILPFSFSMKLSWH